MDALKIAGTADTPLISFDPATGLFELSGRSYPEDTKEFYSRVLEWMHRYSENPGNETNFTFKLQYFNSSSYKPIFDILHKLVAVKKKGQKVNITWHYKTGDRDMHEAGEEFSELSELPFTFQTY